MYKGDLLGQEIVKKGNEFLVKISSGDITFPNPTLTPQNINTITAESVVQQQNNYYRGEAAKLKLRELQEAVIQHIAKTGSVPTDFAATRKEYLVRLKRDNTTGSYYPYN